MTVTEPLAPFDLPTTGLVLPDAVMALAARVVMEMTTDDRRWDIDTARSVPVRHGNMNYSVPAVMVDVGQEGLSYTMFVNDDVPAIDQLVGLLSEARDRMSHRG